MTSTAHVTFPGPAGRLEGLWKDAAAPRARGRRLRAPAPAPRRNAAQQGRLPRRAGPAPRDSGRFASTSAASASREGRYDEGRGEVEDFRAALDEAERAAGLPIVAGGFSFGSAVALRASSGRPARRRPSSASAFRSRRTPARCCRAAGRPGALRRRASATRSVRRRCGRWLARARRARSSSPRRRPLLRRQARRARARSSRIPAAPPVPAGSGHDAACRRSPSKTRRDLLALARRSLEAHFRGEPPPRLGSDRAEAFGEPRALFVTLRKAGELRGCIGTLSPDGDLARTVPAFALARRPSRTRGSRRSSPTSCRDCDDRDLGPDAAAGRRRTRRRSTSAATGSSSRPGPQRPAPAAGRDRVGLRPRAVLSSGLREGGASPDAALARLPTRGAVGSFQARGLRRERTEPRRAAGE